MFESTRTSGRTMRRVHRMRLVKPRSLSAAIAGAVLCSLALSGCDNNIYWGPAAIKSEDGALLMAVCADIRVVKAYGEQQRADRYSWSSFWEAEGSATMSKGDIFTLQSSDLGLVDIVQKAPDLDPGDSIALLLVTPTGGDDEIDIDAQFTNRDAGLSSELWLQPDGSESEVPCPY